MQNRYLQFLFIVSLFLSCRNENSGWRSYRGTPDAMQYSSLDQVDTFNVHLLTPAWTFHTYDTITHGTIECNPIIIGERIYLTSPSLILFALNASTGQEIWRFKPPVMGGINRGITFWNDQKLEYIFFSAGQYIFALNAHNGNIINTFGNGGKIDLREHLGKDTSKISISLSTPPIIYQDLLIIGSATGEGYDASPGHIRAYDTHTGNLKWTFHTIPQKGEYGYETWNFKEGENYGGTNNWGGLSLDEKKGIVFVATGSPTYDFYGANRIGDNLFANCVIALNANTGDRIWHYQAVKHDIWDYDLPCAPTLATILWKGKNLDVVLQPTKMGELIILDRITGIPLRDTLQIKTPNSEIPGEKASEFQTFNQGIKLVHQGWDTNYVTSISDSSKRYVLAQSKKYTSRGMYSPPSLVGTIDQPGTRGGMGWSGLSFDPKSKTAYTNCNDFPMIFQLSKLRSKDKKNDPFYEGERLYMLNCAACHGTDKKGNADGFPALVHLDKKYRPAELKTIVMKGRGLMPSHQQFNDTALNALLDFIIHDTIAMYNKGAADEKYVLNGFRIFTDQEGYPASAPPWGTLNAIDIENQRIKWSVPLGFYPKLKERGMQNTGTQNFGGCVATAGGLIFIGATADEKFRAFDANSGKELWSYQLPAGGYATPAVYQVNGKEYIVIAAGGGNRNNTKSGDAYIAFSLPK